MTGLARYSCLHLLSLYPEAMKTKWNTSSEATNSRPVQDGYVDVPC